MGILSWIRKKLFRKRCGCDHHYRKHWRRASGPYGGYVRRCAKCGKVIEKF